MKRLFYLLTFLIALSSSAWAQYAPVWRLEEVDGSPQVIIRDRIRQARAQVAQKAVVVNDSDLP